MGSSPLDKCISSTI